MKNPVLDDLSPDELEPVEEPKWRKPLIIIGGILLILLMFSLSFTDIVQSVVNSKTVSGGALRFQGVSIIFSPGIIEQLRDEYVKNEHREIKACLFGEVSGGDYYISKVTFPEIIRANVIHIVSVACPEEVLIDLHGHPINSCIASEQDISVLNALQGRNPLIRMIVMCSPSRFALF